MSNYADLTLTISPENQREFGPCTCCGTMSSKIWGYVEARQATVAAYFVEWTQGHEEHAANFDLILGPWGEGSNTKDRQAVSVAFRLGEAGPSFMVMDAHTREFSKSELVGTILSRDEVLGSPVRDVVFPILDVIYLTDPRLLPLQQQS